MSKEELAGVPPLIAAAWRATTAMHLAAEVAGLSGLSATEAHLSNEADALLDAICCAEQASAPPPADIPTECSL